jgi:xanthine dehydrogenase small subunit
MAFDFVLNGAPLRVTDVAPQTNLLDFVRAQGLTGAKEGCAEGECGACAVLVRSPDGKLQAVNSCLIPLPAVADREVYTVESLSRDGLAPAQQAMANLGGSQCGYCTPGFVVSMFAAHHNGESRDEHQLGGNLCRCTGYRPIRDALKSLGPPPDSYFRDLQSQPASALEPFDYRTPEGRFSRPTSLKAALSLVEPFSKFVAGNTDLGLVTNLRDQRFPHLISLEAVAELREFRETPDSIEIGAALTLTEIANRWTTAPPVFDEWLKLFASPLLRNRATLGGSLVTASPIGDSAPLLLALDAELRLASQAGERRLPLSSFFKAFRETDLAHGEIVRSIVIPKPLPDHIAFYKIAKRRLDDISTVAAGISLRTNGPLQARIALGGVAAIPMRATEAEAAFAVGNVERAKEILQKTLRPISDHRGSARYRLAMAQNLLEKFWIEEMSKEEVRA